MQRCLCKVSGQGFTLIELLITLAILTIIGGMLLPVYVRARESARRSTCLSNERQFGLAFAQYAQDWDENLPSGTVGNHGQGWAGQVYPSVKEASVYRCPDEVRKGNDVAEDAYIVSYAMNSNITAVSLADFSAPSNTVLLFEVNDAGAVFTSPEASSPTGRGLPTDNCPSCGKPFGADYYATGNLGCVIPKLSTTPRPYHDPTSNFLASDGHVKSLRGENVSVGSNAPTPDAPQSLQSRTAAGTDSLLIPPCAHATLTFSIR